ncbi:MAG: discoidin domain-containing protein [Chthonomonadales bacterium]|nr:discoidin domain-containing protein [Chthonomonadales bacterium]
MDGVIGFALDAPVTARYVTLAFRPTGWLMLSEVRILDAGNNVARGAGVRYGLRPWPTPAPETAAQYADDGVRLTDGVIAQGLNRTQVFGWDRESERTVEVDLGKSVAVSSATVWTLAGGAAGVRAPSSITLECSDDGVHWKDLGAAVHGPVVEDGKTCEALPWTLRLSRPAALRYLRVRTRRSIGWAMLSEIEVHAADDQGKR